MKTLFFSLVSLLLSVNSVYSNSLQKDTIIIQHDVIKQMTDNNSPYLLVDVRTPQEYNEGHIKGAINIPVQTIEYTLLSFDKTKEIVVVCKGGGRAERAKKYLLNQGFQHVYNGGGTSALTKLLNSETERTSIKMGIIIASKDSQKISDAFQLAIAAKNEGHRVKVFFMEGSNSAASDQQKEFLAAKGEIIESTATVDCVKLVEWADKIVTF